MPSGPPVERTSVMQLPPDLVMPRRAEPDERQFQPQPRTAAGRPRRRRRGWLLPVTVLLVIGLVAAGATWALNGLYMQMPSVLGQPQGTAVQTLQGDGLTVALQQDFSATVGKGKVISSDPGAGTRIRKDATVTLDVSKGPNRPTVPDVSGKSQADAERAIKDAGLAIGQVTQAGSDTVPQGDVISTNPGSGTQQQPNTPVDLVVSNGQAPTDLPNVVGEPVDQATSDLRAAGFTVQVNPDQVFSSTIDAGSVVSQSPNGAKAGQGSTVTLTVSKGQQLLSVPDVTGKNEREAKKILQAAGFKVQAIKLNPFGNPTVHIESPNGGQQAPQGSTVTITLL
jgi:beta-lactam-binding protein with PASTA domain